MALLQDKVAIVTGAGRGIGRAVAQLLAREGARVLVADAGVDPDGRGGSPAPADEVVAGIVAQGGLARASYERVEDEAGVGSLVAATLDAFGGVDVLVQCAGIARPAPVLKMSGEDFDAVVAVNLRGAWTLARHVAQQMVRQGRGGAIVTMPGVEGLTGALAASNQAAASAGLWGLTRALAMELHKHGVRVNGLVPVARTRQTGGQAIYEALGEDVLGPQFVAPAALFLVSELSGELSGEVLSVAGGKLSVWRLRESHGAVQDDPRRPWPAGEIRARWDEISRQT